MELFQEVQRVTENVLTFEEQMAVIEASQSDDATADRIREIADTLIANLTEIRSEMSERFRISDRRAAQQAELVDLRAQVSEVLVPALDDQLFYTLTGYSELDSPPDPRSQHFSEDELTRLRYLAEFEADANITSDLLASAFTLADESLLEPLRERFEAAATRIDRNLLTMEGTQFPYRSGPELPPPAGTRARP